MFIAITNDGIWHIYHYLLEIGQLVERLAYLLHLKITMGD